MFGKIFRARVIGLLCRVHVQDPIGTIYLKFSNHRRKTVRGQFTERRYIRFHFINLPSFYSCTTDLC